MRTVRNLLALMMAVFIFASCSLVKGPKNSEADKVKGFVYAKVWDYDWENNPKGALVKAFVAPLKGACNIPMETRTANTEVVEWTVNSDEISSDYTGFLVTYRVTLDDGSYYALIDLMEFDDGRYEAQLIAIENTLSAIKAYME